MLAIINLNWICNRENFVKRAKKSKGFGERQWIEKAELEGSKRVWTGEKIVKKSKSRSGVKKVIRNHLNHG